MPIRLAVRLRAVRCSHWKIVTHYGHERLPNAWRKLWIAIANYNIWHTVVSNDNIKKSLAKCGASVFVCVGAYLGRFDSLSTAVMMASNPLETGSPVIKSIETTSLVQEWASACHVSWAYMSSIAHMCRSLIRTHVRPFLMLAEILLCHFNLCPTYNWVFCCVSIRMFP